LTASESKPLEIDDLDEGWGDADDVDSGWPEPEATAIEKAIPASGLARAPAGRLTDEHAVRKARAAARKESQRAKAAEKAERRKARSATAAARQKKSRPRLAGPRPATAVERGVSAPPIDDKAQEVARWPAPHAASPRNASAAAGTHARTVRLGALAVSLLVVAGVVALLLSRR
jgi:sRNA-binding protein